MKTTNNELSAMQALDRLYGAECNTPHYLECAIDMPIRARVQRPDGRVLDTSCGLFTPMTLSATLDYALRVLDSDGSVAIAF